MAPGEAVCVTGAGGFIASWIVKLLLEKGYYVKGTIRNPDKAKHLLALPGASDRLEILPADILKPGAFDSIVEGCDGVFHVASFVPADDNLKPEAEVLEIAITGTLNVLESCAKARPKRIVLTSSYVTTLYSPKVIPESVIDETFFSEADYVRKTSVNPHMKSYILSKTLAEEAAWDFVKKKNLNMVVINPVMVTGPTLTGSLNASNEGPVMLLAGKAKIIPNVASAWVGVKDVAKAHVLAYENPRAEGRYIVAERAIHLFDLAALLQKLFPRYTIVAREDNEAPRAHENAVSTEKVKELGVVFEALEDVLRETVACFKELKVLE